MTPSQNLCRSIGHNHCYAPMLELHPSFGIHPNGFEMSCIRPVLFDTPCTITKLLGTDRASKIAFISSPQSLWLNHFFCPSGSSLDGWLSAFNPMKRIQITSRPCLEKYRPNASMNTLLAPYGLSGFGRA